MRSPAPLFCCFLLSAGAAFAGISYDPVCVEACDADRTYCYQTRPECAEVDYCDVCENQWRSCLRNCEVCTDPRSVTSISGSAYTNPRWIGTRCYRDSSHSTDSHWYDLYTFTIQTCYGTRTQYCDGRIVDSWTYCQNTGQGSCARQSVSCGNNGGSTPPAGACPF